jgi:uncharacterized protein YndB with AHSA1/START domain
MTKDEKEWDNTVSATADYTSQIHISATPEKVFDTLTTAGEFASWWAPAAGSAAEGGELRMTFDGIADPLLVTVKQATHPSTVIWRIESSPFMPELEGTTPAFTLSPSSDGGCDVLFRYGGLSPQLACYEGVKAAWEQYLPSLRDYLQAGTGNPYTIARLG